MPLAKIGKWKMGGTAKGFGIQPNIKNCQFKILLLDKKEKGSEQNS